MNPGDNVECAIRIGQIAKAVLAAHGAQSKTSIILHLEDTKHQIRELEKRLATFQD